MARDAVNLPPAPVPSIAAYNIRFLSLSASSERRDQWVRKVNNTKCLCDRFTMVALLETHVEGCKAELFFGRHIDGTERYYAEGFAVLVQADWASLFQPKLEVVVARAMTVMFWEHNGGRYFVFFFRLDAFSEAARCTQLHQATRWVRDNVRQGDWVAFAGDRNFVANDVERQSGADTARRPSERMNSSWAAWLESMGSAYEMPQPEFTWGRVVKDRAGRPSWTYQVLDVVGTNHGVLDEGGCWCVPRRVDDLPYPRASDHWPVGLLWKSERRRKRRRKRKSDENDENAVLSVRRAMPAWLMRSNSFVTELDEWFDDWFSDRPRGMSGLRSFVAGVHALATHFLESTIVLATTTTHKFELALAAVASLRRVPIDERRLSRLCQADPELASIIELTVDVHGMSNFCASPNAMSSLRTRCGTLADAFIAEQSSSARGDAGSLDVPSGLRNHVQSESLIQSAKRLKQGKRNTVTELWDEDLQGYTDDIDRTANIIKATATDRQGRERGDPSAGQPLLDAWSADFSGCRQNLPLHEIETIILDGPDGRQPGPDDVPAVVFKRFARHLAIVFHEAWSELVTGQASEDTYVTLALKKWMVIPKVPGANAVDKLRDLELGNEARKVLARMLFRVLDEVCAKLSGGLSAAQQAFIRGRDIVKNTSMLGRNFWAAAEAASAGDCPYLLLALDCSKGYNCMGRESVMRCLRRAGTPDAILNLVHVLLSNAPVLCLGGEEYGSLELAAGLTQGCPASCLLYIIGVDPMLASLSRLPGVSGVSGFVALLTIGPWDATVSWHCSSCPASSRSLSVRQVSGSTEGSLPSYLRGSYRRWSGNFVFRFGAARCACRTERGCWAYTLGCTSGSMTSMLMPWRSSWSELHCSLQRGHLFR